MKTLPMEMPGGCTHAIRHQHVIHFYKMLENNKMQVIGQSKFPSINKAKEASRAMQAKGIKIKRAKK